MTDIKMGGLSFGSPEVEISMIIESFIRCGKSFAATWEIDRPRQNNFKVKRRRTKYR